MFGIFTKGNIAEILQSFNLTIDEVVGKLVSESTSLYASKDKAEGEVVRLEGVIEGLKVEAKVAGKKAKKLGKLADRLT